jgi:NAD(P)-dependent dehydrogenase (short-subunit alcohol dehydrogenase family)
MKKIALVTGANRGLGLEACRQLAQKGFQVVLTSRSKALGEKAADELRQEGLDVSCHQLDVTDQEQINQVRDAVLAEHQHLDVLINNAGVSLEGDEDLFEAELSVFEETLAVNFYGVLMVTRAFIPAMKKQNYGRVVNVSSSGGSLKAMANAPLWAPAYRISKTALNALTRLMAKSVGEFNIKINAAAPGWVRTRMGGPNAPRDVVEGVDTILWLACLPASGPTGGFFGDGKPHPW